MIKNVTARPVMVGRGQVMAVMKPGNKVPKMLVPKSTMIESESEPGVGTQVSKPKEGHQEGSHIHLKQSIGEPIE